MPIFDAYYRARNGQRVGEWTRSWTIGSTGIRRASQSRWLRRLLFLAVVPIFFFAIPFFLFEQAGRDPSMWGGFANFVRGMPQAKVLRDAIGDVADSPSIAQVGEIRRVVWSFLLLSLMRYPQAFMMVIVVGIVAPPLISQDLRTRAYLIYFSRPITRLEYILGKFSVVSFFLLSISVVPALILYVAGVMLSPSISSVLSTWDLPFRVLLAGACLIVPTTLVALAFSSLTLESRYAGFAWFAIWIMGYVTYSVLTAIPRFESLERNMEYDAGWYLLTSPYHVLGIVQAYVFGLHQDSAMVLPSFVMLGMVSVIALMVLFRRVTAPMQV